MTTDHNGLPTTSMQRSPRASRRFAVRWSSVLAAGALGLSLLVPTSVTASATTLQATVQPPVDGVVTSSPDEPHHRPYDGDYSFDIGASGNVYARFRNASGALALSVASIGRACASGAFGDGGDRITLNVLISGTKVGTVAYAHLTDFTYGTGAAVPVGARIGRAVTTADGVRSSGCWTGTHVHVEPRNDKRYGCYFAGQLGRRVDGNNALGIVGGERGGAVNAPCPGDAEASSTPPGNGAFILRPDGAVFRIAWGAPIYVSTWDAFGGPQSYTDVSADYFNSLPAYPSANTFLRGTPSGRVFRIIEGGSRYYVGSWDPYGGPKDVIDVDDWALDNCDHMRCDPFGSLDSATGVPGGIRLSGWGMDPDSTDPISMHVYSDDSYVGAVTASTDRPDVDAVFHRGSHFGHDKRWALPAGEHRVCIYGINVGAGSVNSQIGCATVNAESRTATTSKLSASKKSIRKKSKISLTADLKDARGAAVSKTKVKFYRYQASSKKWKLVSERTTTSTGRAKVTVQVSATTRYKSVYGGSFSNAPSEATVTVRRR